VRIPSPDPYRACQAIDGGACGIVAPYIESRAELVDLAGAVKYRPLKGELLSGYLNGSLTMPNNLKEYVDSFNSQNICIANIESVPAMKKLDEILSVPDLDAVFIGPHDLSASLGLPEQYDHPEFQEAVRTIIKTTRKHGVHIGIHFSLEPERQVKWIREGVNIIVHSFDIALFAQRLRHDLQIIKSAVGDAQASGSASQMIV
jgi:4-hydroxy-2-oxoheptanedioate aldolase